MKLLICLFVIIGLTLCVMADTTAKTVSKKHDYDDPRTVGSLQVDEALTVGQGANKITVADGQISVNGQPYAREGPRGPRGRRGRTGPQGPRGFDGQRGAPGQSGPVGQTGPRGPRGRRGIERTTVVSVGNPIGARSVEARNHIAVDTKYPVVLENAGGFVENQLVYATAVGYFRITTINVDARTAVLTFKFAGSDVDSLQLTPGTTIASAGERGATGETGATGDKGAVGPEGPEGPKGEVGAQGPQGPKGEVGAQGPVGEKGRQGRHGRPGRDGRDGQQGGTGATGPAGPAGPEGPVGPRGADGPAGPAGPEGPTGPAGPKGEPFRFTTSIDTYNYFTVAAEKKRYGSSTPTVHPDFTDGLTDDTSKSLNRFSNFYVKVGNNPVSPPQNNRNINASQVESFRKECPAGTSLVDGSCNWNLFKYTKTNSWCRFSDFKEGATGCTDCVVRVDKVKRRTFDGVHNVEVVRKLTVADDQGNLSTLYLNGYSCKILRLIELSDTEVANCGFFCFFHEIETIHLGDNAVTCRYIPPREVLETLGHSTTDIDPTINFSDKVSVVSVSVSCQDN